MPHTFSEYPEEPEPQPAASGGGRPPGKLTGAGLLDQPSDARPIYKRYERPHISFWVGVLLLLVSLAVLLAIGLLSR